MHLAIIMDGNGRYGKNKYGVRSLGHKDGAEKLYEICKWCPELNVDYLTVYAFSTENWKRSKEEVDFLMKLFDEIVRCTKKIINEGINPEKLDEKVFSNYLDTKNIPDVDLMIRTGGEYRLSNFLLWQLSYSEIYFSPTLFHEFSQKELKEIIDSFKKRDRRFGGVKA